MNQPDVAFQHDAEGVLRPLRCIISQQFKIVTHSFYPVNSRPPPNVTRYLTISWVKEDWARPESQERGIVSRALGAWERGSVGAWERGSVGAWELESCETG